MNLRRMWKITCFAIKTRVKPGRLFILFECKVMTNRVFLGYGGILRMHLQGTLWGRLQRGPLGRWWSMLSLSTLA